MKASVQYNDFKGTAAADASDHFTLEQYLQEKGVDTERFKPIGVEFWSGQRGYFSYAFICKDNESSEQKAVKIAFESKGTYEDFFDLFKRFEVVVTWAKGTDYADWEFEKETIILDDIK